jgi:thioredoxin-like negative regulator of GroEL
MPVGLTNVFGSTVAEFTSNAADIFGAGTLGETKPHISVSFATDENGKVTRATLTLAITSTTAHWAGSGMSEGKPAPQPNAANKYAIARIESLNKAHEQKHIDTYQSAFNAKKAELEKKYIGSSLSDAAAITGDMEDALRAACETLHSTEGIVNVVTQGDTFTISVSPAGPGGCT